MDHRNFSFDKPNHDLPKLSTSFPTDDDNDDDVLIKISSRPSTPIWKAATSKVGEALTDSEYDVNTATRSNMNIRSDSSAPEILVNNDDTDLFDETAKEIPDARILTEKVVEPTIFTEIANYLSALFEKLRRFMPEGFNDSSIARIQLFLCVFGLISITILIIIIVL